jgi:hypothetical protein
MSDSIVNLRAIKILRWIARVWGIIIAFVIIMIAVTPDPYATEPLKGIEAFYLGLYAVSALGLLIAWKWELIGALISIVAMLTQAISISIGEGFAFYIKGIVLVELVFFIPAILFIVCWKLSKRKREQAQQ